MIRKWIFFLLYHLGVITLLHRRNSKNGLFPILVFHRVSPNPDPFWPPVTVEAFERTIILLKKHYTILPLEKILSLSKSKLSNACFITFDDGFEDTYTWARPVLLKHAAPASFFIATEFMESGKIIWPLQLRNSLNYTSRKNLTLTDTHSLNFTIETLQEKKKAFDQLIEYLATLPEERFRSALTSIFEQLGSFDDKHIQIMTVEQLNDLSLTFGIHSHTRSHFFLSTITMERAKEEFKDSIKDLGQWLPQNKVKFLAYPSGDYNEDIASAASSFFEAAYKVGEELADATKIESLDYRMKIPRFNIHHQSAHEVYALINGLHGIIKKASRFN